MKTIASAHRFHNTVALYAGTGETVYLSLKEARKLTSGLAKICRSIERETYGNSADGLTVTVEG